MASPAIDSTVNATSSAIKGVADIARRNFGSVPPTDAYLAWDAPGVEQPQENEQAKAEKIAQAMNKMQQHNFDHVCTRYRPHCPLGACLLTNAFFSIVMRFVRPT